MIDLFTIRATDSQRLGEVIDLLCEHCDVGQVEHFLADLTRWYEVRDQSHKPRQQDAARRELEQWQAFLENPSRSEAV